MDQLSGESHSSQPLPGKPTAKLNNLFGLSDFGEKAVTIRARVVLNRTQPFVALTWRLQGRCEKWSKTVQSTGV